MYLLYKRLGVDTPVCVMCEFAQTSMRSITYLITVLCKEKFARFSGSFGSTSHSTKSLPTSGRPS